LRLFVNNCGDSFYPMTDEAFSHDRMAQLARYGSVEPEAAALRVRAARKVLDLSAQGLADKMSEEFRVTKATVTAIENERQFPSWNFMRWFQFNHGIMITYFVAGDMQGITADRRNQLFDALVALERECKTD